MGLRELFARLSEKKSMQREIEQQRAMMKNIEQKEINPNEREVIEFREKQRQKQIVDELKQWRQLEMQEYNKGTFLTKDYYFNDNSVMAVPNQFAAGKNSVLSVPNQFKVKHEKRKKR
jgi:hypothetical protein